MKRFLALLMVLLIATTAIFAQEEEQKSSDFSFGLEGVRFFDDIIPGGIDLSVTYTGLQLSDVGVTKLYLKAGGGYENESLWRDPDTFEPTTKAIDFYSWNGDWELGFIQGVAKRPDNDNLIEAFVFYRGREDSYRNYLYQGQTKSDARTAQDARIGDVVELSTAFYTGVTYNSVVKNQHRSKDGIYAEATFEWAPEALCINQEGFARASSQIRGFIPIYDVAPDNGAGNVFNIYAGLFGGVDYILSPKAPMHVFQTFGGRDTRDGLGNCVRGYSWNTFDSKFKAVANAEVRLVGPKIWLDSIVPYFFVFGDCGYYKDMAAGRSTASSYASKGGLLASTGAGVALDLIGFAQLSVIGGFRLVDQDLYDFGAGNMFWGIKFFLHF